MRDIRNGENIASFYLIMKVSASTVKQNEFRSDFQIEGRREVAETGIGESSCRDDGDFAVELQLDRFAVDISTTCAPVGFRANISYIAARVVCSGRDIKFSVRTRVRNKT